MYQFSFLKIGQQFPFFATDNCRTGVRRLVFLLPSGPTGTNFSSRPFPYGHSSPQSYLRGTFFRKIVERVDLPDPATLRRRWLVIDCSHFCGTINKLSCLCGSVSSVRDRPLSGFCLCESVAKKCLINS